MLFCCGADDAMILLLVLVGASALRFTATPSPHLAAGPVGLAALSADDAAASAEDTVVPANDAADPPPRGREDGQSSAPVCPAS